MVTVFTALFNYCWGAYRRVCFWIRTAFSPTRIHNCVSNMCDIAINTTTANSWVCTAYRSKIEIYFSAFTSRLHASLQFIPNWNRCGNCDVFAHWKHLCMLRNSSTSNTSSYLLFAMSYLLTSSNWWICRIPYCPTVSGYIHIFQWY